MQKQLSQYAGFLVQGAVNLQPGQTLIINAPAEAADFARLCAAAAWEGGAGDVVVHYGDEKLARLRLQHAQPATLEDVKPWRLRSYLDYAEAPGGASVLSLTSQDPEAYRGIPADRVNTATRAQSVAMRPWHDLTMGAKIQWCVAAVPGAAWAQKVYPGLSPQQAVEKLWQAILTACRITGGNPAAAWAAHADRLEAYKDKLNALGLAGLHLKSANGTDLQVGLADGFVFGGAREPSAGGVVFLPNIPTEEVFTAPHCRRTQGVVKSSLPYVYNGNVIKGITVRFHQGLAVEYTAEEGEAFLHQMLNTDAGARRIGEIALVPASSPIRQTGTLFYNTLFDENAACHMAFGAGYPGTIAGGNGMSREELDARGLNDSLIHEDVMIGTPDMDIDGVTTGGERVAIFRMGEWCLKV